MCFCSSTQTCCNSWPNSSFVIAVDSLPRSLPMAVSLRADPCLIVEVFDFNFLRKKNILCVLRASPIKWCWVGLQCRSACGECKDHRSQRPRPGGGGASPWGQPAHGVCGHSSHGVVDRHAAGGIGVRRPLRPSQCGSVYAGGPTVNRSCWMLPNTGFSNSICCISAVSCLRRLCMPHASR